MNRLTHILALLVLTFGLGASAAAQTAIPITNHSFETPNLNGTAGAEQWTGQGGNNILYPNGPQGWTYEYVNYPTTAGTGIWGCQDPSSPAQYTQSHPLSSPFDGNQIGFANMGFGTSPTLTNFWATSDPVGTSPTLHVIQANKIYKATIAVGARNTNAWRDIEYGLVLVDSDNNRLGTTVTLLMDPGTSPNNIQEMTFTADTRTTAAINSVGKNLRVRIRALNTGLNGTGAFTQAHFDNVRLTVEDPPVNRIDGWTMH